MSAGRWRLLLFSFFLDRRPIILAATTVVLPQFTDRVFDAVGIPLVLLQQANDLTVFGAGRAQLTVFSDLLKERDSSAQEASVS